jgi:hypothetical protein
MLSGEDRTAIDGLRRSLRKAILKGDVEGYVDCFDHRNSQAVNQGGAR